ncbi:AAA family ATPase [Duganella sp. FT80W]|uniref:AAA family ATPase n=1 Tax=Duganella guangzhouensis TaxID=2666084 RepID=A0A6I2KWS8_9BURK|nr:AAA family ATPase [Duganella guangzhouensis]
MEINRSIFPSRILALSFITNDKFSFSAEVDGSYSYLGVRATGNAMYTSTIEKRLCSHISAISRNEKRVEKLGDILEFLGMERKLRIRHELTRKTLFKSKLNHKIINSALLKAIDRKKYLSYNLRSISNEQIELLISNVDKLKCRLSSEPLSIEYVVDCDSSKSTIDSDELETINILENIEFISPPKVVFSKADGFEFEHTSSGEKSVLYTMISLLAATISDSLILIDEPEISLHPSWQMRYVSLLKNVLSSFPESHCLLATHSHFMVSDIEPKDSDLVTVSRKNVDGNIVKNFEKLDYSTYAWSAENILYQVFNLRTTRNFYFEQELSELLSMISQRSKNVPRIKELVSKFSSLRFNESDPINIVIDQAKNYLAKI